MRTDDFGKRERSIAFLKALEYDVFADFARNVSSKHFPTFVAEVVPQKFAGDFKLLGHANGGGDSKVFKNSAGKEFQFLLGSSVKSCCSGLQAVIGLLTWG